MSGLEVEDKTLPKVKDFFNEKSVFITGSGGFIGSVLLEILLRLCPGIRRIFILLRPKKNMDLKSRKEQIFNKEVFEKLKTQNREFLDKVQVIAGDATFPNLGMSEEDIHLLTEEVSIVFHCAAVISFTKSLKFALLNNVVSLKTIIELARKMKKLKALVYTSTAYSNSNHTNVVLEEEVLRLPFQTETFLNALKNGDDGKLLELFTRCKPDWPNTYTFSKCMAENLIMETASDLPVAIIRPSMVFGTWKYPMPGYFEGQSAHGAFLIGAVRGLLKVFYGAPSSKFNFVPVDIVVNTHVLAACRVGTNRCTAPMIVNCTATEKLHIRFSEYSRNLTQLALDFPSPQAVLKPSNGIIVPNKYLYHILAAYHHYIPAIVLDGILKISGKKPRLFSSYRFCDKILTTVSYFLFHSFEFERKNLEYLDELIHPDDRKDLTLNFKNATIQDIASKIPEVSLYYDWKPTKNSISERKTGRFWSHVIVNVTQGMIILSSVCGFSWILSFLFL